MVRHMRRGSARLVILAMAGFGYGGGSKQAAGTGPYEEDGDCPHCSNGTLKRDQQGQLFCKSCKRRPTDSD